MDHIDFIYDDGGRSAVFNGKGAGDCVTRAIVIAAQLDYRETYDALFDRARAYVNTHHGRAMDYSGSAKRLAKWASPRDGVDKRIYKPFIEEDLGWIWTPTVIIGQQARTHLRADELPEGRIITRLSRHLCAVIDGTIHDTHDPSRDGTRMVYGYWSKP